MPPLYLLQRSDFHESFSFYNNSDPVEPGSRRYHGERGRRGDHDEILLNISIMSQIDKEWGNKRKKRGDKKGTRGEQEGKRKGRGGKGRGRKGQGKKKEGNKRRGRGEEEGKEKAKLTGSRTTRATSRRHGLELIIISILHMLREGSWRTYEVGEKSRRERKRKKGGKKEDYKVT